MAMGATFATGAVGGGVGWVVDVLTHLTWAVAIVATHAVGDTEAQQNKDQDYTQSFEKIVVHSRQQV